MRPKSRIGDTIRSLSRLQRELLILTIALVLGLLVAPAIIYVGGVLVLGPYAGGPTVFALFGNFYQALAGGALAFWTVALGPYGVIQVGRLMLAALRGAPTREQTTVPPAANRRQAPPAARRPPPVPEAPRRPPTPSNHSGSSRPGQRRTPYIKSID